TPYAYLAYRAALTSRVVANRIVGRGCSEPCFSQRHIEVAAHGLRHFEVLTNPGAENCSFRSSLSGFGGLCAGTEAAFTPTPVCQNADVDIAAVRIATLRKPCDAEWRARRQSFCRDVHATQN